MRTRALRNRTLLLSALVALAAGIAQSPAAAAASGTSLTGAAPAAAVEAGHWATLTAELTTAAGAPVSGARVLAEAWIGGFWHGIAWTTTSTSGAATAQVRPGWTMNWRFLFPGTAALASAASSAFPVLTKGPVLAHLTGRGPAARIAPGQLTSLAGELRTAAGAPVSGARILAEAWIGGFWHGIAWTSTNASGAATARVHAGFTTRWRFLFEGTPRVAAIGSPPFLVWVTAPAPQAVALATAAAQRGKPYSWGAAGPYAFDCSGLALYAWARAGVRLPHNALLQYEVTRHISPSQAVPGDLLFTAGNGYSTYWGAIDHVGIYAGHGYWWVAPGYGRPVQLQRLWTSDVFASAP